MSQDGSCVQLTENGDCARVNNLRCTGHLFRLICIQLERSSNDASRDLPACESGLPTGVFTMKKVTILALICAFAAVLAQTSSAQQTPPRRVVQAPPPHQPK